MYVALRPSHEIFYSYRDVTIAGGELHNLGLYSVIMTFEAGANLCRAIILLWTGISVYMAFSEWPPPPPLAASGSGVLRTCIYMPDLAARVFL